MTPENIICGAIILVALLFKMLFKKKNYKK